MPVSDKPEKPLRAEVAELRARLDEAEDTLRAIRTGEVDALVVETRDGPQLYTLESADAASNRFRGEVLAQVSDAVFATDNDERVTFLNAAAEREYGVVSGEVLGCRLRDVYSYRWLRSEDEAASAAALREKGEWRGENIHVTRSGRKIHVESTVTALHNRDGVPSGLLAVIRDISARVESERKLHASEEKFRAAFANAAIGVAITTADWCFIETNPAYCEITGYPADELAGTSFARVIHKEDLAANTAAIEQMLARDVPDFVLENRYLRKDGSTVWVQQSVSLVRDGKGEPKWIIALIENITERKRAQSELAAARDEAEAASRTKDEFLAVLSHELRTPLTPVIMISHTLLGRGDLPPIVRDGLESISRNVQLEAHFIDDLLDVTRISRGKLELAREPLGLHRAVRGATEISQPDILSKEQRLIVELGAELDKVRGDFPRLQQVFWNLLKNASKFTPERGELRVTSRNEPGWIIVEVIDTGRGIDPNQLPNIFETFRQGDESITREYGGLGLGLAISKATIDAHGGAVQAFSAGFGKGTTLRVELPLLCDSSATDEPAE